MRVPAEIHLNSPEHVFHMAGVQRLHLRVGRLGEVSLIVPLNGLVQKRKPQQRRERHVQDQQSQQQLQRPDGLP